MNFLNTFERSPGNGTPPRVTLPFRILSDDHHVAIATGATFSCMRKRVKTDAGITNLWSAYREGVLLQPDCRTLNEAKNVCRAAAQQAQSGR